MRAISHGKIRHSIALNIHYIVGKLPGYAGYPMETFQLIQLVWPRSIFPSFEFHFYAVLRK